MSWLGQHVAEVIALCALFFTAWQFWEQRRHNRLCVTPHLDSWSKTTVQDGKGRIVFELTNNGLGPAVIKSFRIMSNGSVEADPDVAVANILKEKGKIPKSVSTARFGIDSYLPPHQSHNLLELEFTCASDDEMEEWKRDLNSIDLQIVYESVFGDEHKFDTLEAPEHALLEQP